MDQEHNYHSEKKPVEDNPPDASFEFRNPNPGFGENWWEWHMRVGANKHSRDFMPYRLDGLESLFADYSEKNIYEGFLRKHPGIPIPNFETLYNIELDEPTKISLGLNFIKRSFVVGDVCRINYSDPESGNKFSEQEIIDDFKRNFPLLYLPDGPPQDLLRYIAHNYQTLGDHEIIARSRGLSQEEAQRIADVWNKRNDRYFDFGADEEEFISNLEQLHRLLNDTKEGKTFKELPKQEWHKYYIELADNATNEMLSKFGIRPSKVPPNKIVIIDQPPFSDSMYSSGTDKVYLTKPLSNIHFLNHAIHELLHYKSMRQIRFDKKNSIYYFWALGTSTQTKDGEILLTPLNEGLTQMLTRMAMNKESIRQDPFVHEQLKRNATEADRFGLLPDKYFGTAYLPAQEEDYFNRIGLSEGYQRETNAVFKLIARLSYFSEGKYSREDILSAFVALAFRGRIHKLVKIFEEVFDIDAFVDLMSAKDATEFSQAVAKIGDVDSLLIPLKEKNVAMLGECADDPQNPRHAEYTALQDQIDELEGLIYTNRL